MSMHTLQSVIPPESACTTTTCIVILWAEHGEAKFKISRSKHAGLKKTIFTCIIRKLHRHLLALTLLILQFVIREVETSLIDSINMNYSYHISSVILIAI